jgi:hypothetical protein
MIDLTGLWTLLLSSWGLPFLWYSHLFYGRGSLGLNPKQVGAISMKIRVTTYGLTAFYFIKKYTPYTLIQWIPYYQPYRLVGSSACILLGQVLNGAVYKALGFEGVYYCRELGYPVRPWIHGFPFIMPHPQYIGSILTVMGAGGWFGIGPEGPRMDILYLTLYVIALYGYAMMFERGSGIHSLKLCKSCGNLLENEECPFKKET